MSKLFHLRRTFGPAVGCFLGAGSVFAADAAVGPANGAIETIEIVAQKQPYRGDTDLKDLPQSIRTLSADLLADVGVTQLDQALDFASGIARQNSFGGLWDSFAIRGFAGDENVPSGYLVNGFNAGRGFSGRRDASNVESIEVLKGPGSALYGRSEPGGTINLVTKKPKFEREGSIEASIGSFNTFRVAGDYTGPINDALAFRVNGAYEDAKSYRDTVKSKKYTLTPSFLARLSKLTTLSYELELVNQKGPFDRGVVAPNGVVGAVPNSRFLGEPGDGPMAINATGHQFVLQHSLNKDWSVLAGLGLRDSSFKGFSSDAELATARQMLYVDGQTLSRQRRYRDYRADDVSARAELTGEIKLGGMVHHTLFGIDTYRFKLDQVQNRVRPTLAAPYGINIYNPVYGQAAPTPTAFISTLEEQRATGIYGQDQIDLTEHWKALAGIRFDDYRQQIANRITGQTSHQEQKATSPRLGLVYQFNKAISVYGTVAKGFRPNSGSDFAGTAFKPEESSSAEVGAKLENQDGKLSGTIALYKMRKNNILTSDPVNAGFSMAAGEAESQGLEIDASGELAKDLRATFAYAYTDAKVTKSVLDPSFGLAVPAGSQLINIPKHSASLLMIKDFHSEDAKYSLGGGLTYVGARLGETGVPSFQLPAYTLAKLTASYEPSKKVKFTMDVDNLFDKVYYPSSYSRLWVGAGAPRSITLRTQYVF